MSRMQRLLKLVVMIGLLLGSVARPSAAASKQLKVAIVVPENAELLDFSGPAEVFSNARLADGMRAFKLFTVSPSEEEVKVQGSVVVHPDYSIDNSPRPDIIVVPGGGTTKLGNNERFMTWFKDAAKHAQVVMSVCTGAFVLAKAGLLDGKEATTHHNALAALKRYYPKIEVRPGPRFVDEGSVITTAGISAGIDGALHLVARLHGSRVAEQAAQYMEYGWVPDRRYAGSYSFLDPTLDSDGGAIERASLEEKAGHPEAAIEILRQAVSDGSGPWYPLAHLLHTRGHLDEALAAYRKVPADSSWHAGALYNEACIFATRGETEASLDALAAAIKAGFRMGHYMMRDPDLRSLHDNPRFRALVEPLL